MSRALPLGAEPYSAGSTAVLGAAPRPRSILQLERNKGGHPYLTMCDIGAALVPVDSAVRAGAGESEQRGEEMTVASSDFLPQAFRSSERVHAPDGDVVARLLEQAGPALRRWGHTGHEVALERAVAYFADPGRLRCTFWCETCHVAHVVPLPSDGD